MLLTKAESVVAHLLKQERCGGRHAATLQCTALTSTPLSDILSSAKFVLIVEKDATFQRLLDDDFCTKLSPCIMITVRGRSSLP